MDNKANPLYLSSTLDWINIDDQLAPIDMTSKILVLHFWTYC